MKRAGRTTKSILQEQRRAAQLDMLTAVPLRERPLVTGAGRLPCGCSRGPSRGSVWKARRDCPEHGHLRPPPPPTWDAENQRRIDELQAQAAYLHDHEPEGWRGQHEYGESCFFAAIMATLADWKASDEGAPAKKSRRKRAAP